MQQYRTYEFCWRKFSGTNGHEEESPERGQGWYYISVVWCRYGRHSKGWEIGIIMLMGNVCSSYYYHYYRLPSSCGRPLIAMSRLPSDSHTHTHYTTRQKVGNVLSLQSGTLYIVNNIHIEVSTINNQQHWTCSVANIVMIAKVKRKLILYILVFSFTNIVNLKPKNSKIIFIDIYENSTAVFSFWYEIFLQIHLSLFDF